MVRKDILECLEWEVRLMPEDQRLELQQRWRDMHGFREAMASINDMALQLADERGFK